MISELRSRESGDIKEFLFVFCASHIIIFYTACNATMGLHRTMFYLGGVMDKRLCAAAVQFNIALGDVDQNLAKAAAGLARAAKQGAQLAVLPEMWSSGYDYKRLAGHAEKTPGVLDAVSDGG